MLTACGIETTKVRPPAFDSRWCVATVLTACGIETHKFVSALHAAFIMLQQCLPLAVLKLAGSCPRHKPEYDVATVLTACGIETVSIFNSEIFVYFVATVLTACGIETG